MPKRASRWVITETKNGWDLAKGGRYMYQDLGTKQEALSRMKNYYRPGEPVFIEEIDGYRENITLKLRRNGLI
jgi:hypothetical protein